MPPPRVGHRLRITLGEPLVGGPRPGQHAWFRVQRRQVAQGFAIPIPERDRPPRRVQPNDGVGPPPDRAIDHHLNVVPIDHPGGLFSRMLDRVGEIFVRLGHSSRLVHQAVELDQRRLEARGKSAGHRGLSRSADTHHRNTAHRRVGGYLPETGIRSARSTPASASAAWSTGLRFSISLPPSSFVCLSFMERTASIRPSVK